jgi:1,4-alpha-glucan branching enzyme
VIAFTRLGEHEKRPLVCVCNLSPIVRERYRVGLPLAGEWLERVNTDSLAYGGSGIANGTIHAAEHEWHGQAHSAELTLPPLATLWLSPAGA